MTALVRMGRSYGWAIYEFFSTWLERNNRAFQDKIGDGSCIGIGVCFLQCIQLEDYTFDSLLFRLE